MATLRQVMLRVAFRRPKITHIHTNSRVKSKKKKKYIFFLLLFINFFFSLPQKDQLPGKRCFHWGEEGRCRSTSSSSSCHLIFFLKVSRRGNEIGNLLRRVTELITDQPNAFRQFRPFQPTNQWSEMNPTTVRMSLFRQVLAVNTERWYFYMNCR